MERFTAYIKRSKKIIFIIGFFLLFIFSFAGGWFMKNKFSVVFKSSPMRLTGFKFVKPLLICDTSPVKKYPELHILESRLNDFIKKEKEAKNINTVSVYFQDFKTDGRIDINKDERFRSASIGKVPIMIAFYKMLELDSNMLSKKIKYTMPNLNEGQEIAPKDYAKTGNIYTIEELIEKMIKYSDNNSLYALLSSINFSTLKALYTDIQVPFPINAEHPEDIDYITSKDVSYFFRILYNGSYLTNDFSEKALQVLSEADYKNGLVAGVPEGISVAHKFGSDNLEYQGVVQERELHDCGIIYNPKNPYLLCIMTKSSSNVANIENTIKGISSIVYQQVDTYSK